jgi:hypothetical protein
VPVGTRASAGARVRRVRRAPGGVDVAAGERLPVGRGRVCLRGVERAPGGAVHADPIENTVQAPGTKRVETEI